jgi:hypothetical protein
MCTINRHGHCINNYCSCSLAHWTTPGGWATYEIYDRNICNRIIGYLINLFRKQSFCEENILTYGENISDIIQEIRILKRREIERKYGLIYDECVDK